MSVAVNERAQDRFHLRKRGNLQIRSDLKLVNRLGESPLMSWLQMLDTLSAELLLEPIPLGLLLRHELNEFGRLSNPI